MSLAIHQYISATDEELAALSDGGNRDAFAALYDRYFDKLSVYARSFLNNEPAAEDAVQEVFFRFMRRTSSFDPGRKFSAWIFQVTKNQCLNTIRNEENRARLRKALCYIISSQSEPEADDYGRLLARMPDAVQKLSEKERMIFRLRFRDEKTIREISATTGSPEGTVKSAIFYILKKISAHLKQYIHE